MTLKFHRRHWRARLAHISLTCDLCAQPATHHLTDVNDEDMVISTTPLCDSHKATYDKPTSDNPTPWELKLSRHFFQCDICNTSVDCVFWMKGQFLLCPEHFSWRGYAIAWLKKIRRASGR